MNAATQDEKIQLQNDIVNHVAINIETGSATPRSLFQTPSPNAKIDYFDEEVSTVERKSSFSTPGMAIPPVNRIHPLSDGEVDYYPHPSSYPGPDRIKGNGMPRGPMSDTGVEYNDQGDEEAWHWSWGGLPQFGSEGMDYDEKVESFLAGMEKEEDEGATGKGATQLFDSFMDTIEVSLCGLKEIRGALHSKVFEVELME